MTRELASNDRLVQERWPVLFWVNRGALIAAAVCLASVIALLVYEATQPLPLSAHSELDGLIGVAYVLTGALGLGFMLTGYLRLFLVHRVPGHASQSRPVRGRSSPIQRLAGLLVFTTAVAAGWVHWGLGTVMLFLVVFAVVYLPILWR